MHVGFFSGDITRSGGTENVSVMIANRLVAHDGYEVSFVSLFEERPEPFFAINSKIRRFALYPTAVHGIRHYADTCRRLRNVIRAHRIDVLVDIDGILDMYSLPIRRGTGVKVISWEHFNYHQNPDVPYRKITRRWAARSADAIVTLTQADKKLYEEHLRIRRRIYAIPNPMRVPPTGGDYDLDSRMIVSAGRLTYQKGFDLLIDVASEVLPAHPDWQWVVLGDGEDREALERKTIDEGLEGRLIFRGRVTDMDEYYRHASMFVLTSRFEGLPMVLLEAKAHRIPIIGFDCETGPSDIVTDGVNGYLIPCFDTERMSMSVEELITNPRKRSDMASHALDDAERFDMDTIIRSWIQVLNEVTQ